MPLTVAVFEYRKNSFERLIMSDVLFLFSASLFSVYAFLRCALVAQ